MLIRMKLFFSLSFVGTFPIQNSNVNNIPVFDMKSTPGFINTDIINIWVRHNHNAFRTPGSAPIPILALFLFTSHLGFNVIPAKLIAKLIV